MKLIQMNGATALDDKDGDITDKIVITGKVDTKKEGTYIITYTVEDSSKNIAIVKRTVVVKNDKTTEEPTTPEPEPKPDENPELDPIPTPDPEPDQNEIVNTIVNE